MKSMMQLALLGLLLCIHLGPFANGDTNEPPTTEASPPSTTSSDSSPPPDTSESSPPSTTSSDSSSPPYTSESGPSPTSSDYRPPESTTYSGPPPSSMPSSAPPMTTRDDEDDDDEGRKGKVFEVDLMGKVSGKFKFNLTNIEVTKIWKDWAKKWNATCKRMTMMKNEMEMWKMAEDILGKKGAVMMVACMKGKKKMGDEDGWNDMKREMSMNWAMSTGMDMDEDGMGGMMGGMGDMDEMDDMDDMEDMGDMEGMGGMGDEEDDDDSEGGDGERMMEEVEKKKMMFKKCMKGMMDKKKMVMREMMKKIWMMKKMWMKMMWKKKMMMMRGGDSLFDGAERVAPVTLVLSVLGLSAHVFYF